MTVQSHPLSLKSARDFNSAAKSHAKQKRAKRSDVSPLVIRVTAEERERLNTLAAGMTLSAYVRACVFGQEAKRRKRRPKHAVEEKKAVAEALALLGQSRIANNLNQLAYHANIGALDIGDAERVKIDEAYAYVLAIRALLLQALGQPQRQASGFETAAAGSVLGQSQHEHSEASRLERNEAAASHLRRNEFRRVRTQSHRDLSEAARFERSETAASRCARTRSHHDQSSPRGSDD